MLVDVHAHFYHDRAPRADWHERNASRLAAGDKIGISVHVASILGSWGRTSPIYFPSPPDVTHGNDALLALQRAHPDRIRGYVCVNPNYTTHARAYLLLVADPYPGFTGKPGYPVDLEIDPPRRQNRWTVFFRGILAIPALFLSNLLSQLNQLLAIFSWFIALITGRVPEGLRNFAALAIRIETQTYGYVLLLTDRYPSFNVGIES